MSSDRKFRLRVFEAVCSRYPYYAKLEIVLADADRVAAWCEGAVEPAQDTADLELAQPPVSAEPNASEAGLSAVGLSSADMWVPEFFGMRSSYFVEADPAIASRRASFQPWPMGRPVAEAVASLRRAPADSLVVVETDPLPPCKGSQ